MEKTFIVKDKNLTKKEQIKAFILAGHRDISYSGAEQGFYVDKL